MKRKNNKSSIVIIVFFISVILISSFTYFLNPERKISPVESFFKDISINLYGVFTKGITIENNLNIKNSLNNNLIDEVSSLKKVLELNHDLSGFNYVNATILSRNVSYWMNNVVIDKGKKDGIKKDNCVITSDGLIGKITNVNNNSSVVKLLTSSSYKVSVKVGNKFGILDDYDSKSKLFIVNSVDKDVTLSIGDDITTSGLGGVFPSGIFIGKVEKIKNDEYGTSKIIYIKPNQDFNDIRYVTILENKDE